MLYFYYLEVRDDYFVSLVRLLLVPEETLKICRLPLRTSHGAESHITPSLNPPWDLSLTPNLTSPFMHEAQYSRWRLSLTHRSIIDSKNIEQNPISSSWLNGEITFLPDYTVIPRNPFETSEQIFSVIAHSFRRSITPSLRQLITKVKRIC